MSDIKTNIHVGDKVRYVDETGYVDETKAHPVLAVHGDFAWLGSNSNPWTCPLSKLTKEEPFFEAGKTYKMKSYKNSTFEVIRVDKDSDGTLTAYGKRLYSDGGYAYTASWNFSFWEEVPTV